MFLRKLAMRSSFIGWLISAALLSATPSATAANEIFYDGRGSSGCVNGLSSNSLYATKLIATRSVTVTTINVVIGTGAQVNFSTSRYYIMANNPTGGSASNGAPSTVLATFTPDSISGSGASTSAKFVGSYTVSAGSTYWVTSAQNSSSFPTCYWNPSSVNGLGLGAFKVDTSTSGSNNSWLRAYASNRTNPVGASWTVALPDATTWQFSLENTTVAPVIATIETQSGSRTATFRTATALQVNVDAASKVTFYANEKVISGCRNVLSSIGVATCNWKPSVHGSFRIYARAIPISNAYIASNSALITIGVTARANIR